MTREGAILSVRTQLLARVVIAIAAGMVMLVASYVALLQRSQRHLDAEASSQQHAQIQHTSELVRTLVQTHAHAIQAKLDQDLLLALHLLEARGGIQFDAARPHRWRAINQLDHSAVSIELPGTAVGGEPLGAFELRTDRVPFIDEVGTLTGSTFTLFQRMNPAGDMLRIATNVDMGGGRRAVGTYIPAIEPSGERNQVIRAVLSGQTFRGTARVVDEMYVTAYHPLVQGDQVVGVLYAGSPESRLVSVQAAIDAVSIGASGFATVVRGTGTERGRFATASRGASPAATLFDQAPSAGDADALRRFVDEAVTRGAARLDGVGLVPRDGSEPRPATLRATYYAPWDWVIVTVAYHHELQSLQRKLAGTARELLIALGVALFAAALLTVLAIVAFTRPLVLRLESVSSAAESLAQGERYEGAEDDHDDEIGRLTRAVHALHLYLSNLADASASVAQGRFDVSVGLRSEDDRLSLSFSSMVESLRSTVGELRSRTDWQAFQEGVGEALSMALDERDAVAVLTRTLQTELPAYHVELLLADASHANLESVIETERGLGCDVAAPMQCPAIRDGSPRRFPRAADYTACPHAWSRGEASLSCTPVRVAGRAVGVLHTVRSADVEVPARAPRRVDHRGRDAIVHGEHRRGRVVRHRAAGRRPGPRGRGPVPREAGGSGSGRVVRFGRGGRGRLRARPRQEPRWRGSGHGLGGCNPDELGDRHRHSAAPVDQSSPRKLSPKIT
jgi:hypothetical protein